MSSFRFKSYQNLNKIFGQADAIVECIELGVRQLCADLEKAENFNIRLAEVARDHRIKVTTVTSVDDIRIRASQMHILTVYYQFEGFLENLFDEHPSRSSWKKDRELSLFKNLLSYAPNAEIVSQREIQIIEHYRLVRNVLMHADIEIGKRDASAEKLKEKLKDHPEYGKYDAPNAVAKINFDDFILFTKVAKDVAEKLCQALKPNNEAIVTMLRQGDRGKELRRLMKFQKNPVRYKNALMTFIRTQYAMADSEAEPVATLIINGH